MRLIREQCEHIEKLNEESVSSSGQEEHSEVQDDYNIQEKGWMKLVRHTGKYNYNSDVDESTRTDIDNHKYENEVNEEEDMQNKILHICYD